MVCLLFLLVSMVIGYDLWLQLFLDIFYTMFRVLSKIYCVAPKFTLEKIICHKFKTYKNHSFKLLRLTLILLSATTPTFANSVDPDQMASEEAIWSGSLLFVIQFVNLNENIICCNLIGR